MPANPQVKYTVVELKIPALADYVALVRLNLYGVATRMGFTEDAIADMKVAVSEACTNAVQHAYNKEAFDNEVIVRFLSYADKLVTIIKDNGKGFDPKFVERYIPRASIEKPEEIGLGVTFIKSLMDEVEYDTGFYQGTQVRLVKYLAPFK